MHNLIEPPSLVAQFLHHPPEGFAAIDLGDTPAFSAEFDIRTTMDAQDRQRLQALPLRRFWQSWLRFPTCFIGTTVTEYAPLPVDEPASAFVKRLLKAAADYPLLIIKDLPTDPHLVGDAARRYSGELETACRQAGFVLVEGQALAHVPIDFPSTDVYLARMSRSRRRDLRRKLRSVQRLHIQAIPTGAPLFDDAAMLAELYALYRNVYSQSEIHFDLLSAEFFRAVLQDAGNGGVVFLYRAAGQLIGYNLCFAREGMLLDKYVGFAYPQAREYNLYAVSWFNNLDYALANGLTRYVAGWTDPEIKRHLGASFSFTRHAVRFRNPWLRRLLASFKHLFEADAGWQRDGA